MKINWPEKDKFYSLNEIVNLKLIPIFRTLPTLSKWVEYDRTHDNYLKATVMGDSSGTRYQIKGENIITLLIKLEEEGLDLTPRKEEEMRN